MEFEVIEQSYPEVFRQDLTKELIEHLNKRESVVFVGMRRVGISNFLRFFLNHKRIRDRFSGKLTHLFIPVDLNDLTERTLSSFWILTLKRILDATETAELDIKTKKYLEKLFLDGIQSKNIFLLIENIKKALSKIISDGFYPTIFFIRFDRITEAASAEFFANLEGLKTASNNKLALVFTTSRGLNSISPKVFSHTSLSLAQSEMFLKPASETDLKIISDAYIKRFGLRIPATIEEELIKLSGGYIQYFQLALIALSEPEVEIDKIHNLPEFLTKDERINLQSEELWEDLTPTEQKALLESLNGKNLSEKDLRQAAYLLDTGLIIKSGKGYKQSLKAPLENDFSSSAYKIFSPIFEHFLKNKQNTPVSKNGEGGNDKIELSKKEHLLFSFLKENLGEICEREAIIEAVWPEEEALGVSDWAIDRLVARLRKKIKEEGEFEIVTIKTRGFKLVGRS